MKQPEEIYTCHGERFRKLRLGETIRNGDHSWPKSFVPDGGGSIDGSSACGIGGCTVKETDGNFYFRKLEPVAKEEIYTYADRPGEEYRKLKVGEKIIPSDAHLTKSAVPRGGGLLRVYLTSGISSTVKESDGNAYFRCINSPHKDLRKATFGLLDYWLTKYKFACEDEDERRVWQSVIDSLTPNE